MEQARKTCAITGCSAGIGKATAIEMAKMGYEVIALVRDSDKSREALEEIRAASGSDDVRMFYVDLASRESIERVADEIHGGYSQIDVLINNAGVYKRSRDVSPDGHEMTLAVNYVAPVLLTELLLPLLEASHEGRIINLTSEMYKKGRVDPDSMSADGKYKGQEAYATSKLLVAAYTRELSERLQESSATVNCVHPGVAGTDVFREYPKWFNAVLNLFISKPEDGAKPVVYLATSSEVAGTSGRYFNKTEMEPIAIPVDAEKPVREIMEHGADR